MEQVKILSLLNDYNNTDRKTIKDNLKRVMHQHNFKSAEVMDLGYNKYNVYSWTNIRANNIPMFDQALNIAVHFGFDVKELLKTS